MATDEETSEDENEQEEVNTNVYKYCLSLGTVLHGSIRRDALRIVRLPEGLREIENNAFEDCRALKVVTLPSSVTRIGKEAFMNSGLEHFVAPPNVYEVGDDAFAECKFLKSINLPAIQLGKQVFRYCTSLKSAHLPHVERMGINTFEDCYEIENITLSDVLCELPIGTFTYCTSLKQITLPFNLTTIGDLCFYGCENLVFLELPDYVNDIGGECFLFCENIEYVSVSMYHTFTDLFYTLGPPIGKVILRGKIIRNRAISLPPDPRNNSHGNWPDFMNDIEDDLESFVRTLMQQDQAQGVQDSLQVFLLWERLHLPSEILNEFLIPCLIDIHPHLLFPSCQACETSCIQQYTARLVSSNPIPYKDYLTLW